jgi:hypothetical protein
LSGLSEWERCKGWIEAALSYGGDTHSIDDVWSEIEHGKATFWPGKRAAVVTEFFNYPRKRALNFWLLGGDPVELIKRMRPDIEAWGQANGATLFLGFGRPDQPTWGRALRRHGYRLDCIGYAKEVSHEQD